MRPSRRDEHSTSPLINRQEWGAVAVLQGQHDHHQGHDGRQRGQQRGCCPHDPAPWAVPRSPAEPAQHSAQRGSRARVRAGQVSSAVAAAVAAAPAAVAAAPAAVAAAPAVVTPVPAVVTTGVALLAGGAAVAAAATAAPPPRERDGAAPEDETHHPHDHISQPLGCERALAAMAGGVPPVIRPRPAFADLSLVLIAGARRSAISRRCRTCRR